MHLSIPASMIQCLWFFVVCWCIQVWKQGVERDERDVPALQTRNKGYSLPGKEKRQEAIAVLVIAITVATPSQPQKGWSSLWYAAENALQFVTHECACVTRVYDCRLMRPTSFMTQVVWLRTPQTVCRQTICGTNVSTCTLARAEVWALQRPKLCKRRAMQCEHHLSRA